MTNGNTEQLVHHFGLARQNGASEQEIIEAITHLAFYAGCPQAMAAMTVAKGVFRDNKGAQASRQMARRSQRLGGKHSVETST